MIISHLLLRLASGNLYTKPGAQISRPHANMISREWSNTIPSFVHFSGCFLIDTVNNQNITVVQYLLCVDTFECKCHEWSHFYNAMLEMTTRQEMCKNVVQLCESRQHIVMCQTEQDIWNSLRPVSSSYFDFDLSLKLDLIYRSKKPKLYYDASYYYSPCFIESPFLLAIWTCATYIYICYITLESIVYTCVIQ